MNIEKFTQNSQELIKASLDIAILAKNQFATPLHLLSAIISKKDPVIVNLITTINGNLENIKKQTETELSKLPKVSGENLQTTLSQDYNMLLLEAENLSTKAEDTYITTERLFQALAMSSNKASEILRSVK